MSPRGVHASPRGHMAPGALARRVCSRCSARRTLILELGACSPCLAGDRAGRAPKWGEDEERIMRLRYGLVPPADLAAELHQASGHARTVAAVLDKASRMGLDARENPGDFTIAEAARTLRVRPSVLTAAARRLGVKFYGRGRCRFVSIEGFGRLWDEFHPESLMRPTVPLAEAARRTGYGDTHLRRLLKGGVLRGWRRGMRWHVDRESLEALEARLRREGAVRLDWRGVASMDAVRERARAKTPEQRAARREAFHRTWIAPGRVAELLGVTLEEVRARLERGELAGGHPTGGGRWWVRRDALDLVVVCLEGRPA